MPKLACVGSEVYQITPLVIQLNRRWRKGSKHTVVWSGQFSFYLSPTRLGTLWRGGGSIRLLQEPLSWPRGFFESSCIVVTECWSVFLKTDYLPLLFSPFFHNGLPWTLSEWWKVRGRKRFMLLRGPFTKLNPRPFFVICCWKMFLSELEYIRLRLFF